MHVEGKRGGHKIIFFKKEKKRKNRHHTKEGECETTKKVDKGMNQM